MESDRIVVLTALPLEADAVRAQLTQLQRRDLPAGTIVEEGTAEGSGYSICLACTGPGNHQAAVVAERVINWAKPTAVLFVGVAGGLKADIAVGDVVAATQVIAYHGGKQAEGGFKARPATWEGSHRLLQAAQYTLTTKSWLTFLPDVNASSAPRVHFKPIASGEIVKDSADSWLSDLFDTYYNGVTAIEMEAAGVASAAQQAGVPLLVIRGISDRADGTKSASDDGGSQPRAAQHAAALALGVITELRQPSGAPGPADSGVHSLDSGLPPSTPPGSSEIPVRWSMLPESPAVTWRTSLQQAYGTEPATLEVHLVPVGADARLEVRRMQPLWGELVQLGRDRGLFGLAEAVEGGASAEGAVAYVRNHRQGSNSGLAVLRTGQRTAWEALPKPGIAAVFDPEHIAVRVTELIHLLLDVQVSIPREIAPLVGLEPTMLVTQGKVGVPQGSAVTLSIHQRPLRIACEESVSSDELRRGVNQVAQELSARLDDIFRTQR